MSYLRVLDNFKTVRDRNESVQTYDKLSRRINFRLFIYFHLMFIQPSPKTLLFTHTSTKDWGITKRDSVDEMKYLCYTFTALKEERHPLSRSHLSTFVLNVYVYT